MFKESEHPRGDDGRFVDKNKIEEVNEENELKNQELKKPFDVNDLDSYINNIKGKKSLVAKPIKRKDADIENVEREAGVSRKEAQECINLAEDKFDLAEKKDKEITKDVIDSVKKVGGECFGLDFRIKTIGSLARKIGSDAKEKNLSFDECADDINDVLRYTAILGNDDFVNGYNEIKSNMEKIGYQEVRCKNFYNKYKKGKSDQKAIQCLFEDKNGYKFEFQFHTDYSIGVKENYLHERYEKWREKDIDENFKNELSRLMKNASSYVPNPKGIESIEEHNFDDKKEKEEVEKIFKMKLL